MLGILLKEGTLMNQVFAGEQKTPAAMEAHGHTCDSWQTLLEEATSLKSPAAKERLWNGGPADGGLHNLFLDTDKLLCLFDMGEPKLMLLPAFPTKFLFSFFHALGMVDDWEKRRGWENRFELVEEDGQRDRIKITKKTKKLLPQVYSAFNVTVRRLVDEFFLKEDSHAVRKLLVAYATLQLLSDAAFCLERWKIKGGGRSRKSNHHKRIDEWLWRSIWDIYIASDLSSISRLKYLGVSAVRRKASISHF